MEEQERPYRSRRRSAVRVAVPAAVATAIAVGVGLVPALASDTSPDLPAVTAEQLVAKVLGADADAFSGTVKVKADLGLPPGLSAMAGAGGMGGGRGGESGADPSAKALELLGGEHTLQVAVDGPERQRIGLLGKLSGFELVHNGTDLWAWDSAANEAVHATAPEGAAARSEGLPLNGAATPQEVAKRFLAATSGSTSVAVDGTTSVAGRKAYLLSVKPSGSGSTLREVRVSVDAEHGVPLAVLVTGTDGDRVFDARFSSVSFTRPDAKTFAFSAPKGAKVTEHRAGDGPTGGGHGDAGREHPEADGAARPAGEPEVRVIGEAWTAVVAAKLPQAQPADGQPPASSGREKGAPLDGASFAKSLGKPVGGGTLISTKVVNVLVTDDGRVFAGAVTLPVLQSAAGVR
ncbi:LolA family protein [Kitasatospora camelliae]|uniref:DUF2092 domain-containing protein n=1 Tax=Kitasatospora camelliae TaxID=3156397 RepID=A0AAU8JXC8_9ACTN